MHAGAAGQVSGAGQRLCTQVPPASRAGVCKSAEVASPAMQVAVQDKGDFASSWSDPIFLCNFTVLIFMISCVDFEFF